MANRRRKPRPQDPAIIGAAVTAARVIAESMRGPSSTTNRHTHKTPAKPKPRRSKARTRDTGYLTIDQAAEHLGVERRHIYRLINSGELHAIDIAMPDSQRTRYRLAMDELDRFIVRRTMT